MPSMAEQVSIPVEMMPNEPVQQEEAATSTVRQEIPQIHHQVMGPSAEELAREEEEARLQAKEEARKLLTQPVVQISAEQRKTVSQLNRESREKHVIHPIDAGKRYNSKSAVNEGQAVSEEAARSDKNEVAVKSSLKKILDDSNPHK